MPNPDPELPLPSWWTPNPVATTEVATDMCEACGHVRDLHGLKGVCRSKSHFGANSSCTCLGGHPFRKAELPAGFNPHKADVDA